MKKLLMALSIMLGFTAIVTAQKAAPAKIAAKPATAKVVKMDKAVAPVAATNGKAVSAKPATPKAKPAATTAAPVKADGTPDMRYKENKAVVKPAVAGPKKADGTADMRFKANKTTKGKS